MISGAFQDDENASGPKGGYSWRYVWAFFLRRIPIGSHRGNSRSSDIPGTSKLSFCEACAEGKAHIYRAPFKPVGEIQSTKRLELVHSDGGRTNEDRKLRRSKYFVTFIDDYSRCITVYPMKHKSEVLEKFKGWRQLSQTKQIVRLRHYGQTMAVSTHPFAETLHLMKRTLAPRKFK